MSELLDLTTRIVELARKAGATASEASVQEGDEFSVEVRMGEVETLTQSGSRAAGVRILIGQCTGSSYTSDLTPEGIDRLVRSAIELAEVTTEDPFAGLPDPSQLGIFAGDLRLFSGDVDTIGTPQRIALAQRTEKAAQDFDPRITNSDGASFGAHRGRGCFANSLGFAGETLSSTVSLGCVPIASTDGHMERDYFYSSARSFAALETPEEIGRKAGERTVRRLGARKVATQRVPVIFEARVARSICGHIFDAIDGRSIYRKSSFLLDRLHDTVASTSVTLIDDATLPGLFGSQPFDDEGVLTRRTVILQNGVLKNYIFNSYSARKLQAQTTGNASRGVSGNAGIGYGNLFLEAGSRSPEQLIASLPNGFYVTELIGSGVNTVTGDYSRGASGLWIEGGELAYPVSEVTLASTLQEILKNLEPANDLEFRGSVAAPTLLAGEMTVGGK